MKKKLLFLNHTLQIGGAEKILVNLLKYIDKSKYDITVMTIVNDGIFIDDVEKIDGIKYKYIFDAFFKKSRYNKNSKFYHISNKLMNIIWKFYIFLCKYFPKQVYKHHIKETFDVEIAFLEGKCAKLIHSSYNKNSKKIAWIHTDISKSHSFQSTFLKGEKAQVYKDFDKIFCVSEEVKQRFIKDIQDFGTIEVKLNPIDCNEILKLSKEKIDLEKKDNIPVICSVGRLVYEKGFDILLKIHKKLIDNGVPNILWIIGEGIERASLEKYISDNNLQNTVKLLGYQSNPYKYVAKSDLFVCSSRTEGLSAARIEAALLCKPVVTTDTAGVVEIFGNSTENALITKNDLDSLYEGLYKILTNKDLYKKYSDNIANMENKFSIEKTISAIEDSIDDLLKN